MTAKILTYITRKRGNETHLLVFEHVDHRDAGVHVPKGTVEHTEAIEHAAKREVREETGLTLLRGLRHIAHADSAAVGKLRLYRLKLNPPSPMLSHN